VLSDVDQLDLFFWLQRLEGLGLGYALVFCVLDWHAVELVGDFSGQGRLFCDR
jgi:hypothetical protein